MRSFRAAAAVLLAAGVASLLWAGSAPGGAAPGQAKQRITARAFVALDAATGRVLTARRAGVQLPIASLTKIMTGLLVIERGHLHDKIAVPTAATLVEPSKEYLVAGRQYKRLTLLWSALLASANDSATALAWDAGGGSLQRFYDLMNERARQLGMTATTYASASGLEDRRNRSTALDQALLARAALRNGLCAHAGEGVGQPQPDADHGPGHVRRQDRLDDPRGRLPGGRGAPRRPSRDRGRARLEGDLARHAARAAARVLRRGLAVRPR
jgi:D-alanyl-D-alanine carboxypeptidase